MRGDRENQGRPNKGMKGKGDMGGDGRTKCKRVKDHDSGTEGYRAESCAWGKGSWGTLWIV